MLVEQKYMYIPTVVKCNTVMKQITTLFAVLRRCLYSIDQKILLGFCSYTRTQMLSYQVRAILQQYLLLSNVISRILCSERYICKYTLYFRLIQSHLTKLKAFFPSIFLFKIKTLGKHYTFTHVHKEFVWFQRN